MNTLTPGQHVVDIDGVRVSYHVAGTGPVCLVHPGGPGFSWRYLRMPVVQEYLTTVYVEPIGTGDSGRLAGHPHGYTRDRYVQAVAGVLDHLDVPKAHLLGHSHGGFVAQRCALRLADRLAGVVLYDSAAAVDQNHFAEANNNLMEFVRRNAGHPGVADIVAAWQSVPTISTDDAFVSTARALLPAYFADYWGRAEDFADFVDAATGTYVAGTDDTGVPDPIDDRAELDSIEVDTLVLVGRYDFICGPRWANELHKGIPGSQLVTFEHSGHFAHMEQPTDFAKTVVDFVRDTVE